MFIKTGYAAVCSSWPTSVIVCTKKIRMFSTILLGLLMTAQALGELRYYMSINTTSRIHVASNSGLYFTLNGTVYQPGDSILITDVGVVARFGTDPGSSLVCVTSNVNTQCCRSRDSGNVGEWYFPNGTMVPRNSAAPSAVFTWSGFTHQVRLNRRNSATSPTGTFECRVPDEDTGELVDASITLTAGEGQTL